MTKAVYAPGSGQNNTNLVDHAQYADAATSATSATNATNATNASSVPWTGVTSKPTTFPPAAHGTTHNLGGGDAIAPDWSQVQNKPGTFPPVVHASTHNLGGSDAIAPDWSQVQNKPSTFAPAPHETSHVTGTDQIPSASSSSRGLLAQTSGNTTDFVDGTNACQNLVTAITPTITSFRLRAFQALGNCNFEVDQRNVGNTLTGGPNGLIIDRWGLDRSGPLTAQYSIGQQPGLVAVPGTSSYNITRSFFRITVTTAQSALAASDRCRIFQYVEGPNWRELSGDVHSISLLVRSNVANLKFGLHLVDQPTQTQVLTKLCTIASAGAWQLISLASLPVWPAGNFTSAPGAVGYLFGICLAGGSSVTSSANDVWVSNGSFLAAAGQSNFLTTVGNQFDIAFVQHSPGSNADLMDLDFDTNLSRCQRMYQKSYSYSTIAGTNTQAGMIGGFIAYSVAGANGPGIFKRTMAKVPTVNVYSSQGTINNINLNSTGAAVAVTGTANVGDAGFPGVTAASTLTAAAAYNLHYTADTGW
jgi:hypothetical protein